jgi:hypothetical protein
VLLTFTRSFDEEHDDSEEAGAEINSGEALAGGGAPDFKQRQCCV